jgi:hypothetical protein
MKFWTSMMKHLARQNGGPWSQIVDKEIHFKFDSCFDNYWRRNKMKLNFHFDDHHEASRLRDLGMELEHKTVHRINLSKSELIEVPNVYSLELDCQMITTASYFRGTLYLSKTSLAFEAKQTTDAFGDLIERAAKLVEINIDTIEFVLKRRYLHVDSACEVFTTQKSSRFFIFSNAMSRAKFFKELKSLKPERLKFIQFGDAYQVYNELKLEKRWNSGSLTNYEYLYWLNLLSGRSIHDLSQYPVFPWVLSDYSSEFLDLYSDEVYRDLSKPLGALNSERVEDLRILFSETKDQPFACLYRFHYSAPAYIIGYLLRKEPFTSLHIQLQNGRFDLANRLFYSVKNSWHSIMSASNDFRELIPEFFGNPEFLLNSDGYDLGARGQWEIDTEAIPVNDVLLPDWAQSAAGFVALNRIALESPHVSLQLHEWIDLVFGYKQRSEVDDNVFHPWSYCESIEEDATLIPVIQQHASNFGITPTQLFRSAHVPRKFRPPQHRLLSAGESRLVILLFCTFERPVLKFAIGANSLVALYSIGSVVTYSLANKAQQTRTQLDVTSSLPAHRIFMIPSRNAVVLSAPWSDKFVVFGKRKFSPDFAHSSAITAIAVDGDFCVSTASVSSMIVWDLEAETRVTEVIAHTSGVVAVALSAHSEMLVSCDVDGNLVFSALKTGGFLRKTKVCKLPDQILLAELGFCILICSKHGEVMVQTEVLLLDWGGRMLADREFQGRCTAATVIQNSDQSAFLVIAQETKIVYVLTVWDLRIVAAGLVGGEVIDIAYNVDDLALYFLVGSSEVHMTSFAVG